MVYLLMFCFRQKKHCARQKKPTRVLCIHISFVTNWLSWSPTQKRVILLDS